VADDSLNRVTDQTESQSGEPENRITMDMVICGVDGSEEGTEAIRQALELGTPDAKYWVVSAWDPTPAYHAGVLALSIVEKMREQARGDLHQATDAFPVLEPMLIKGRDVTALLAASGNLEADLIAVGSHGKSRAAGIVFGSVASAMARYAPCTVLIARQPPAGAFPGTILHANDGSTESLEAARVSAELAVRHDSTLVTLHASGNGKDNPAEVAGAIIEESGLEPVLQVEQGPPHRKIVEVANSTRAGLVVMGSRGRTGLAALGSVSERVAHRAPCSVLIVRRPAHPVPDDRPA
jgi:nucleotide-binding universal stress UspA family protein